MQTEADADCGEPLNLAELLPFADNEHEYNRPQHPPFGLTDYFELVDWTGRAVKDDNRGAIPQDTPPTPNRLNLSPEDWINTCCHIEHHYKHAIWPVGKLTQLCEKLGQRWMHSISHCQKLYPKFS